jgi:hypothetical protein
MARLLLAALQGALLVKRTTGDASQIRDVVAALKAELSGAGIGHRASAAKKTGARSRSPAAKRASARS